MAITAAEKTTAAFCMGFPFTKCCRLTKVEFDRCVRKGHRNVLIEFNVDECPLVCEGCRNSQMPSPSLVDSREPNGQKTPPRFLPG
jgi:hypothetical protein